MESWKRNLYIVWAGCFLTSCGMGMVIPFLPMYVQQLGVEDVHKAAVWSSLIFGANHLMIVLVSPMWGRISDTYGQKMMMVRSGIVMAIVMVSMGFVTTPLGLLLLRMVFGTFAGFTASATALLAIETPKEHVGKVLGTLQTGSVTGQLLGPLFGGIMAGTFGMRNSFYITGTFLLLATLVAWIGVKEATKYRKFRLTEVVGRKKLDGAGSRKQETPLVKKTLLKDIVKHAPMLVLIYISTYLVSYSLQSISPIITLYVSSMNVGKHVELIGGLVFGASALGTMLAAPLLGRLGDRVGHPIILLVSMGAMALLYIPQALANDPWTLLVVRFLAGICYGGLVPAITSILRSMTPISIQGSVHGYNSSISSLGNVCGAIFGGIISGVMGFPHLFYTIGSILFVYFLVLTFLFGRLNRAVKEQVESNH